MLELPSNIYLVKNKAKLGIALHVKVQVKGERISKSFNFSKYGGEEPTLVEAYKFLTKICTENNIKIKQRSLTSDMPGVSRTEYIENSVKKQYWQAQWQSAPSKQETRRFSIFRHGEEKAKQLAIDARNHATESIEKGKDPVFVPPKTKGAKLWRYMDFTKFISMIENSGIFFVKLTYWETHMKALIQEVIKKTESSYIADRKNPIKEWIIL